MAHLLAVLTRQTLVLPCHSWPRRQACHLPQSQAGPLLLQLVVALLLLLLRRRLLLLHREVRWRAPLSTIHPAPPALSCPPVAVPMSWRRGCPVPQRLQVSRRSRAARDRPVAALLVAALALLLLLLLVLLLPLLVVVLALLLLVLLALLLALLLLLLPGLVRRASRLLLPMLLLLALPLVSVLQLLPAAPMLLRHRPLRLQLL
jgi:ABC-type Na+ efflux pump permease subunit